MFQRLRQTRTQIEADLVISRLRAAGLHPSDLRIWPHVTLAGADMFYNIEVPGEEIDSARQIMDATDGDERMSSSGYAPGSGMRIAVALVLVAIAMGVLIP